MSLNNLYSRNRRARIARLGPKLDPRQTVADDLTTITYHPTKGRRRVSGKRIVAQLVMASRSNVLA